MHTHDPRTILKINRLEVIVLYFILMRFTRDYETSNKCKEEVRLAKKLLDMLTIDKNVIPIRQ